VKTKRQLSAAELELRREWGRRQGRINAETRFTRDHQRKARRQVPPESCAANGAKGAARTAELHGYEVLFESSRQHRLAKPSRPELLMIGILARMGVVYEREWRLRQSFHTVDFFVPSANLVIEVEGAIHEEGKPGWLKRQDAKQRKAVLLADMGVRVLTVTHLQLADMAAVIDLVRGHL
jgi:very-short-patch-repair endonuclease